MMVVGTIGVTIGWPLANEHGSWKSISEFEYKEVVKISRYLDRDKEIIIFMIIILITNITINIIHILLLKRQPMNMYHVS